MKPKTQEQLKKAKGGCAIYYKPHQILDSKYKRLYLDTHSQLSKLLNTNFNKDFDRIYFDRKRPVGSAPAKMDCKYTPPVHCLRYAITMKGIQNVIANQQEYYYAYHCIYNKQNTLQILQSIVDNGFKVHPQAPNGKIHGAGIYVTPSFSTVKNFYAKKSLVKINDIQFEMILQVRVKKGSFTKHHNTVLENDDWPEQSTQWLIADPNPTNIVVIGILLRNQQMLK